MTVTLSPTVEALIQEKVASGRFRDASEVVEVALIQMDERDRLDRLRASLLEAEEQLDRGEGVDWSPELLETLILRANENSRAGRPISDDVKP
jgi:antitoxin ParD1/3/4